jgi:WD40 repeat protein
LSERMRGSSLLSVRFSPDGRYFAVGAANGQVVVWNASSRGEILGWRAHEVDVVTIDISPDRKWLATGALEEGGTTFRVWRLQERLAGVKEVLSDGRHVGGVWTVCFSPDSRLVAAGGWTMSGYTAPQLYEVETGRHVGWLHWDVTRAMRFSPDGRRLVTGDDFGTVKLWVIGEHHPTHEHEAHADVVRVVGFSPDGERYYSGSLGGGVKVWETETGRLVGDYPVEHPILACRFGDDGRVLMAASAAQGAGHPDIHKLA